MFSDDRDFDYEHWDLNKNGILSGYEVRRRYQLITVISKNVLLLVKVDSNIVYSFKNAFTTKAALVFEETFCETDFRIVYILIFCFQLIKATKMLYFLFIDEDDVLEM